jgi:diadenosine tetraphosphate (Ap4A) HIT family hydrolase
MNRVSRAGYFERVRSSIGANCHVVLNARGLSGHIVGPEPIKDLRSEVLSFSREAGISDLTKSGMRMVIDVANPENPAEVHLFAGEGTPCACFQDWRNSMGQWNPNTTSPFLEAVDEAAKDRLPVMKFGPLMFYPFEDSEVVGVSDGDPKADVHFVMLATKVFRTMLDPGFNEAYWIKFLEGAYKVLNFLNIEKKHTRFIVNTGNGFQNGPRVHMHVLNSRDEFPSLFPQDYGFLVGNDGKILAPTGSFAHETIIQMIEKRIAIQGFTPEAAEQRKKSDETILSLLKQLGYGF